MAEISTVAFLVVGYVITVALEAPVLWWGLSRHHGRSTKLLAIFGLTAATYPGVVLALPPLLVRRFGYAGYVTVAEVFAAVAEALIFHLVIATDHKHSRRYQVRDAVVVVVANVVSFSIGSVVLSNVAS